MFLTLLLYLLCRLDAVKVVDCDVAAFFGEGCGEEGAETAGGEGLMMFCREIGCVCAFDGWEERGRGRGRLGVFSGLEGERTLSPQSRVHCGP